MEETKFIWKDRKRWKFLGLPWTFTKYALDEDKLTVKTGFFNSEENEVRLYRILDIKLKKDLLQKLVGLGTIAIVSSDQSLKNFEIKNIKNPKFVKDTLSNLVEEARDKKRVVNREIMGADSINDDDDIGETPEDM